MPRHQASKCTPAAEERGIIRGAMNRREFAIECKNKSAGMHEIPIPPPKFFDTSTGRTETTTDIVFVNLLCPECRRVFAYTAQDVRDRQVQTSDRNPPPPLPTCFGVEFVCGLPNCESHLEVHVLAVGHEDQDIVFAQLKAATFHVKCAAGHYPLFDLKNVLYAETRPFSPF
jgi:hypothetical protein